MLFPPIGYLNIAIIYTQDGTKSRMRFMYGKHERPGVRYPQMQTRDVPGMFRKARAHQSHVSILPRRVRPENRKSENSLRDNRRNNHRTYSLR